MVQELPPNNKKVLEQIYSGEFHREAGTEEGHFRNFRNIKNLDDLCKRLILNPKMNSNGCYTSTYPFKDNIKEWLNNHKNETYPYEEKVIFDCIFFDFDLSDSIIIKNENPEMSTKEINKLSREEKNKIKNKIKNKEKSETANLSNDQKRDYYSDKYENRYLFEPINDAQKLATELSKNYGVECLLNFSGGKGCHCRILFNETIELKNPNEVVKILGEGYKKNYDLKTLDSAVYTSSTTRAARVPCTMHQKTGLYANPFLKDTTYLTIIDNANESETKIVPIIDKSKNDVFKDLLIQIDEKISFDKKNNINTAASSHYTLNGDESEFTKNFLKIYVPGQMNSIGHRLIHLLRRTGWNENQILTYFKSLPIAQDIDVVDSWINTAFKINPEQGHLGGLNYFVDGVKLFAPKDEVDSLIKYFTNYFVLDNLSLNVKKLHTSEDNEIEVKVKDNKKSKKIYLIFNNITSELNLKLDIKNKLGLIYSNENVLIAKFSYKTKGGKFKLTKDELDELVEDLTGYCESVKECRQKIIKPIDKYLTNNPDYFNITLLRRILYPEDKYVDSETRILYKEAQDPTEKIGWLPDDLFTNPTAKKTFMQVAPILEEYYNIRRVTLNKQSTYYYFNKSKDRFEVLTPIKLSSFLREETELSFNDETINGLLKTIARDDKINPRIWEFKNYYFNGETFDIIEKSKDELLTLKQLGFSEEKYLGDDEIHLLRFNPDAAFHENDFNPDDPDNPENATLTETTIKRTLVDKFEPGNLDMLIDFLQRLGIAISYGKKYKSVLCYYGGGNNGKSILFYLIETILNDYSVNVDPGTTINDQFYNETIGNKNAIIFDELDENTFSDKWDFLKRISGAMGKISARGMFTDETKKYSFNSIFLGTNILPRVPLEQGAVFDRLDALKMPNTFKIDPSPNKREYPLNRNIHNDLKNDIKGLEWLVSMGLILAKEMIEKNQTFRCHQTEGETKSLFTEDDIVLKFLSMYLKPVYGGVLTGDELRAGFRSYINYHDITYKGIDDNKILGGALGKGMKVINPKIETQKPQNKIQYLGYELKEINEVERDFKIQYQVMEIEDHELYKINQLDENKRIVYNQIKKGNNTANRIMELYEGIPVMKSINELVSLDLIETTDQLGL